MKLHNSMKLLDRALELIPNASQTASKSYNQFVLGVFPVFAESMDGCILKCVDNNEYISFMAGLGPNILDACGSNRVKDKVIEQMSKGILFDLPHRLEVELAEKLRDVLYNGKELMFRFGKDGSSVVSVAVRLARHFYNDTRLHILRPKNHYSGWHDSFGKARPYGIPKNIVNLLDEFKYNNIDELELKLSSKKYCAVVLEPVSLIEPKIFSGGTNFLQKVRQLCTKYDTLLIADEMITGFRFGLQGCQGLYEFDADISCYGKAISNGFPLGVLAGKKHIMKGLDKVFFSGTYFGETMSIVAAIATINELEQNPDIFTHIWQTGSKLKDVYNNKAKELNLCTEMIGCAPRQNLKWETFDSSGCNDLFKQEMVKRNILWGTQIYTTYAHKKHHIDKAIISMHGSLEIVAEALAEKNIDKYLDGQRSMSIFKKVISGGDNANNKS